MAFYTDDCKNCIVTIKEDPEVNYLNKLPKQNPNRWFKIRHVPADSSGWDITSDTLVNDEAYGDPKDDSEAWARRYSQTRTDKYRIESGDHVYKKEYKLAKDVLNDEFLKDESLIKAKGGFSIYMHEKDEEAVEHTMVVSERYG